LEEEEEEAAQCVVPLRIWRSFRSRGHSRYIYKAGRMFVLLPHVGGYVDIQQSKQEKKRGKRERKKRELLDKFLLFQWNLDRCPLFVSLLPSRYKWMGFFLLTNQG
jgi:hypothetical protein